MNGADEHEANGEEELEMKRGTNRIPPFVPVDLLPFSSMPYLITTKWFFS